MSTTLNKKLATSVVIINWIFFALFTLIFLAFVAICVTAFDTAADLIAEIVKTESEAGATPEETKEAARVVLTVFAIVIGVAWLIGLGIQLALNILLTRGVNQANRRKCNIWLVINLVIFILGILGFIRELYEVSTNGAQYATLVFDIITLTWLGISLFLIKKYRDELGTNASYAGVVYSKTDNPV